MLAIPRLRVEGEGGVSVACASGGYPLVVPIQAAGLGDLNGLADLRRLYSPGLRAVHLQGLVTAPVVVMGKVVLEDPPQMPLTEHHDVLEAFPSDAADHPLNVG
jgi:hypothetical protein